MKLFELFNSNPSLDKEEDEYGYHHWVTKLSDGSQIVFHLEPDGDGGWSFWFDRNGKIGKTGDGHDINIELFSVVIQTFRQFNKQFNPTTVHFDAEIEPEGTDKRPMSRANLYARLAKTMAGNEFTVSQEEANFHGDQTIEFTLTRKT